MGPKICIRLWEFAHEMWIHRSPTLHNSALPDCHRMKGAAIDVAITTVYDKVDSYAAGEDQWRFDLPLAPRLDTNHDSRGQSKLNLLPGA
jgi:hypothetical protein